MEEDPLLQKGVSPEIGKNDPIKEGLQVVGLDENVIIYLGERFKQVFDTNGSSRNGLSMLRGAMFALGSQDGNPEWREHCAGSLRELLNECTTGPKISTWFCATFKDKNPSFPNSSTHSDDYGRLSGFYNYFSEVHHHNATNILQKLRFLYGDQIKAGDDSKEMFIKAVKDFLEKLYKFFNDHVKNI